MCLSFHLCHSLLTCNIRCINLGSYLCVLRHSVVSDSLCPRGLQPARLLCPWDSPGKNTGVGCHALLQRIFPTQGSNWGLLWLLHCRQILYLWATWETLISYGWLYMLSHVQLFATLNTAACQAPLSMGFSRQEYWSGKSAILQYKIKSPCLQTFKYEI